MIRAENIRVRCEAVEPEPIWKENLILSGGSFDKESGYWLFDLDDGYTLARIRKGAK